MWQRAGECCRCGECCRGNPFTGEPDGWCPLARMEADAKVTCTDREHPYYLAGCVVWPTHPAQIADKPSCSYTFTWID